MTPAARAGACGPRLAIWVIAAAVFLCLGVGTTAGRAGFIEGPMAGVTGGFGEPSCHQCHFDNPLNQEAGRLNLVGVPPQYEPETRYVLTIDLSHPDARRSGFELSARFGEGAAKGTQAGTFRASDDHVQVIADAPGALTFAVHTAEGTATRDGRARWTVEWVAPMKSSAPVLFHLAGNAGNDDESPLGDFIYLMEARSSPRN